MKSTGGVTSALTKLRHTVTLQNLGMILSYLTSYHRMRRRNDPVSRIDEKSKGGGSGFFSEVDTKEPTVFRTLLWLNRISEVL